MQKQAKQFTVADIFLLLAFYHKIFAFVGLWYLFWGPFVQLSLGDVVLG